MNPIPPSLAICFAEYRLEALDLERDAVLIIERTLEDGTRAELRWLFASYGLPRIRDVVRRMGFRKLSKRAFAFWRLVLGVEEYVRPPWLTDRSALWRF